MGDVNAATVLHADQQAETKTPTKNQGTLKADGKEHTFFAFSETASVSHGVNDFLGEINEKADLPETILEEHTFTVITQETIEIESEIMLLSEELKPLTEEKKSDSPKEPQGRTTGKTAQTQNGLEANSLPKSGGPQTTQQQGAKGEQPEVVYSSLFSLAHSFNKGLADARKASQADQQQRQPETRDQRRLNQTAVFTQPQTPSRETHFSETRQERDQEKDEEQKEGSGGNQEGRQQQKKEEEQKKRREVFNLKVSRKVSGTQPLREESAGTEGSSAKKASQSLGSVENIYIRFMALMARILGQAEAEAHDLYMRIKERTDNIDLLTLLISKINSEQGAIDWTNNQEMKQLIEKARAFGVDIAQGKLKWSEDEKKLLKENIQMRKDSMEKVTQLERTDMQRYLQEASQCHQARSNVLKLLKEVMDTIIHNMRP
ncbi:MAG: hypothetical protein JJU12_07295 [Chlamydiales bacterium]|nr:hypothetical protein [Chlamydiales bacterium]